MPVRRQPVVGEPAGHPRKEEGGEVREHPRLGQDQEPGVVRHHLQPPELLLRPPAAPPVAGRALEGAVLPRRQGPATGPRSLPRSAGRGPPAAGSRDSGARPSASPRAGAPAAWPARISTSDRENPAGIPAKRGMELEALANRHGRSIARPGRERQRKIPAPRSRAHATQTSPVSRKTSRNQRGMPLAWRRTGLAEPGLRVYPSDLSRGDLEVLRAGLREAGYDEMEGPCGHDRGSTDGTGQGTGPRRGRGAGSRQGTGTGRGTGIDPPSRAPVRSPAAGGQGPHRCGRSRRSRFLAGPDAGCRQPEEVFGKGSRS